MGAGIGGFRSTFAASGGYEAAGAFFNRTGVRTDMMEHEIEHAGGPSPLASEIQGDAR